MIEPAASALLTDLHQLTMALGYWRAGRAEQAVAFHLYFRTAPFHGGYTVACGLEPALAYLLGLRFTDEDLAYLATLPGADPSLGSGPRSASRAGLAGGDRLFPTEFLDYLRGLRPALDVDMVPEGTWVFPNEPLVRVRGPLRQAQLVETALLTHVGFPTLVATKAARACLAAGTGEGMEFGLRRAQGPDGGLTASQAPYIGAARRRRSRRGSAAAVDAGRHGGSAR